MNGILGFVDCWVGPHCCATASEGTKSWATHDCSQPPRRLRCSQYRRPTPPIFRRLPPAYHPAPVETSGWYLRGYVGMTNQQVNSPDSTPIRSRTTVDHQAFATFDSSPLFGLGVGYQLNNWFRFDVTGEYRANSHFHGQQVAIFGGVIAAGRLSSEQERAALPRQRLRRSRHVVVRDAVRRRRHRRLVQHDHQLRRYRR